MSSIEDLIDVPVKKAAKSEKKPKKKRKEEVEAGSGDEAALDKKNKKKRKREEIVLTEEEIAAQKAEKSRKKWKKRDAKEKAKSEEQRTERAENPLQFRSAVDQRKLFLEALSQVPSVKNMTELELAEVKLPKNVILKPTALETGEEGEENGATWQAKDAERIVLDLLGSTGPNAKTQFLRAPKAPTDPFGSPMVIILARTAIRCVNLIKYLLPFRKYAHLGSLFAKHKKLEEQAKFLREWHCQIAVGTPNRVLDLADNGALKLDRCVLFIIDMERDPKSLSILDAYETREELFKLYKNHMLPQLSNGTSKLAFF